MKPIKNRVFCPECGRAKMLFDSKKRAMTFIRFNKEEILAETGFAPKRCYYCEACGGWHLTSLDGIESAVSFTRKIIRDYKREMNKAEDRRLASILKEADSLIDFGIALTNEHKMTKARRQFELAIQSLECAATIDGRYWQKQSLKKKVEDGVNAWLEAA